MLPYLTTYYGNPHSRTHAYGWESEKAVEKARLQIADLINADPKEIIFTSGATESNNISIKGVARFYKSKKNHVITTQTVINSFEQIIRKYIVFYCKSKDQSLHSNNCLCRNTNVY